MQDSWREVPRRIPRNEYVDVTVAEDPRDKCLFTSNECGFVSQHHILSHVWLAVGLHPALPLPTH